jgi:predicted tellurium resistance membrane protein TerC
VDWITEPQGWVALLTLTALEVVLGVDNIVFISILSDRLPPEERRKARLFGLSLALIGRIALLLSLSWIMGLTKPLFSVVGYDFAGRSLILVAGGLFLLAKATMEIHHSLEGHHDEGKVKKHASFRSVILQILLLDIVFSLDSVITAVGMVQQVSIMITAVVIAVVIMMLTARPVSEFIQRHPTVKMLALSFLLLVGVALVADGLPAELNLHIPRGYIYFAMAFSVFVEILNFRIRGAAPEPVELKKQVS